MRRSTALLFLAVGVALLAYGLTTASRLGDAASPGAPAEGATWVTVVGTVGVITGGLGLFIRRRS